MDYDLQVPVICKTTTSTCLERPKPSPWTDLKFCFPLLILKEMQSDLLCIQQRFICIFCAFLRECGIVSSQRTSCKQSYRLSISPMGPYVMARRKPEKEREMKANRLICKKRWSINLEEYVFVICAFNIQYNKNTFYS